jgi:hypothetical protein
MHLNNDQLLEPTEEETEHLSTCDECQLRAENLNLIRSRLQSIPETSAPVDQWQKIRSDYYARLTPPELISARRSKAFWQVASVAIAASFALFMIWQSYYQSPDENVSSRDITFAALIKENNILQQQLTEQLKSLKAPNSKTAGLLVQLEVIDTKLQKAYLEKHSSEQKAKLWEQQQVLLRTTLSAIRQPDVIRL